MPRIKHRHELIPKGLVELKIQPLDDESDLIEIKTREALLNALQEACEVEHGLLLQYLFAAFSIKQRASEGLTEAQFERARSWKAQLLKVAREEMAHLATVCNLVSAVGGVPTFSRPPFPSAPDWYPWPFTLERFSKQTIERFVLFETPSKLPPPHPEAARAPPPVEYHKVGNLYRSIARGFNALEQAMGPEQLFIGPSELQDASDWTAGMEVLPVRSASDAIQAIRFIVIQGEGLEASTPVSHYAVFTSMRDTIASLDFDPSRPVASNPMTRSHRGAGQGVSILPEDSAAKRVAELFNDMYSFTMLMLVQFYVPAGESHLQRDWLQAAARRVMSGIIRPIGEILTGMEITTNPATTAGPGFEIYGALDLPPRADDRFQILQERLDGIQQDASSLVEALKDSVPRLGFVRDNIGLLASSMSMVNSNGDHDA